MNWSDYNATSKQQIIEDLTKSCEDVIECVSSKFKNGCLYSLWKITRVNSENYGKYVINIDRIEYNSRDKKYYIKSMTESMFPYHYYDCPLRYLKIATVDINEEWRKKVIAKHKKHQKN